LRVSPEPTHAPFLQVALLTYNRRGLKGLPGTNILAYWSQ
jgi:hypothetical protein